MKKVSNPQISLKPQDVVLLLKLASKRSFAFTYAALAAELCISVSEAHASVKRVELARLVERSGEQGIRAIVSSVREFILHGAQYAFPPVRGPAARGMVTAHSAPPLRQMFAPSEEMPVVWPHASGNARGMILYPLYPSVPLAAEKDEGLYESLTLFDALRGGTVRDREIATKLLSERLQ